MSKKNFKGQALAIVMVVLVVASIIGVALFSRISKNRRAAIDEQNSSIAGETSDTMLDVLIGANMGTFEDKFNDYDDDGGTLDGKFELTDFTAINGFLTDLGLDGSLLPDPDTWCPGSTDNYNVKLIVEKTDKEGSNVAEGGLLAYNFLDATFPGGTCNLTFDSVTSTTGDPSLFIIKQVYSNDDPIVNNYCVGIADCSDIDDVEDFDVDGIIDEFVGPQNIITDLENEVGTNGLAEVRVLVIRGSINVDSMPITCISNKQYNPLKVTAEANCNGSYRAKQMFLPGSGNMGYSTLFDYGIYDSGTFEP